MPREPFIFKALFSIVKNKRELFQVALDIVGSLLMMLSRINKY